ncbi:MAG: hypothetical protein AAGA48_18195 [Myxococcota bacterium]
MSGGIIERENARENLGSGGSGAAAVLERLGLIVRAALETNVEVVDRHNVVIQGPHVRIPNPRRVVDLPAAAPEASRTGPTPGTLVYSATRLALDLAFPGRFTPGPSLQSDVERVLSTEWAQEGRRRQAAIALLVECLDDNPYARPSPDQVLTRADRVVHNQPVLDSSSSLAGMVRVQAPPATDDPARVVVLAAVVLSILALVLAILMLAALVFRNDGAATALPQLGDVVQPAAHLAAPTLASPAPTGETGMAIVLPQGPPGLEEAEEIEEAEDESSPNAETSDTASSEADVPSRPAPAPGVEPVLPPAPYHHDDLIDPWGRR